VSQDCFASWYITDRCNFDCPYCFVYHPAGMKGLLKSISDRVKRPSTPKHDIYEELDDVLERFLATGMTFTFGFTGGEPCVVPRFLDICRRIAAHEQFMISLDTNLTMRNIEEFIEAAPPEKVEYISAALHLEERRRIYGSIDPFLDNVRTLMDRGYTIVVNHVMHPAMFEGLDEVYGHCKERGVRLKLKPFKGVHDGRTYPRSYTGEQRRLIDELSPTEQYDLRSRHFTGLQCKAGRNLIRIWPSGDITRCVGDYSLLGNIYTGFDLYDSARPCVIETCPCFDPERLIDDFETRVTFSPLARGMSRIQNLVKKIKVRF
jgi:MoaA/NifB/PqqE/SkfB family radical SAM enzyme